MSIWLWVVIFLTWCAFLWIVASISQFRELVMKNERLDHELRHAKRRLLKTENARMADQNYIEEKHKELDEWSEVYAKQSEVLNEWVEALYEWVEAYDFKSDELDRALDLTERLFALHEQRRLFRSFEEVDDLFLQKTTKEFIKLEAFARATEVKEKQRVVNINIHKDLAKVVDDISDTYKKIRSFYSDEGHEDIERLIEEEKLKFLNEEERSSSIS